MAKSQKRSSREAKKPKSAKKPVAAAPLLAALGGFLAGRWLMLWRTG